MYKKYSLVLLLAILLIILIISPQFKEIAWWVAIFLFWMRFLQDWFKSFTWWTFEELLQKSTNTKWKWILFGFIATSLTQSSSIVSIITVSFLSAWLISLIQGISIVMWSSLWTTTWIWLIAWFWMKMNIAAFGMPMIVLWIILVFQKSKILKWIWNILAWLWFVFLWIHYMKVWFEAFSSTINLSQFAIEWYLWVIIFTLIWLLMTVVMQSSHATIMLVLTALATWQVSFENSLALTIWANIWTSFTSFIVSLTWNKDWKRVWLSEVLMKISAALFIMVFFYQFVWVNWLLTKILGIWVDNFPLQLALFHTLFNVVWVSIMLIWINRIIPVLKKVFPDDRTGIYWSIYLTPSATELPSTALISLIKETRHLYYNTIELVLEALWLRYIDISWTNNFDEIKKKIQIAEVEDIDTAYDKKIKLLFWEIIDFATNTEAKNEEKYSDDFKKIKRANRNIVEVVKDIKHMQKNLKRYLRSTNPYIKEQYETILKDIITIIKDIARLQSTKSPENKFLLFNTIKKFTKDSNIVNNWVLDKLIREHKISNEMATSLMNDNTYKIDMFKDLLNSSQIVYNKNVTEEISDIDEEWVLHDHFGLTKKDIKKMITDYGKQIIELKKQLKTEKDSLIKENLEKQISSMEYIIKKYEKPKSVS